MMKHEIEKLLQIRYINLHFSVEMAEDTTLPADKVSALRGGMGEMLMRANCVRDRKCAECDFEEECIVRRTMYSKYKESPQFVTTADSIGYLIECENYDEDFCHGDMLHFNLVLFGRTIVYFSQYVQAFFALGNEGIGKRHSRFRIASVTNTRNQPLLSEGNVYMENYRIQTLAEYVKHRMGQLRADGCKNRIVFQTPTALKYQGEFQQEYSMEAIWAAALRRIYMLEAYEETGETVYDTEQLKECRLPDITAQESKSFNVRRYSSTQDRKMMLNGMKGYVQLDAMTDDVLPFLLAGELTHIGKNISFGFGKYSVR